MPKSITSNGASAQGPKWDESSSHAYWDPAFDERAVGEIFCKWSRYSPSAKMRIGSSPSEVDDLLVWQALDIALKAVEAEYRFDSANIDPPPAEMEKRFQLIESAALGLIKALGLNPAEEIGKRPSLDDWRSSRLHSRLSLEAIQHAKSAGGFGDFPPRTIDRVTYWRGKEALWASVHAVRRIRLWARMARSTAIAHKGRTTKRGNPALKSLVEDLLRIWVQILGQKTSSSRIGGNSARAGQLTSQARITVDYLSFCLTTMRVKYSESTLLARIEAARTIRPLKEGEFYVLSRPS